MLQACYHVELGHKKRATITLNRGLVHTPEQCSIYCHCSNSDYNFLYFCYNSSR